MKVSCSAKSGVYINSNRGTACLLWKHAVSTRLRENPGILEERMNTRITEMLGIEYPIIQGGMAWVAEHNLAAAVSEAGGLGLIGGANAPGEVVREEIRKARELTKKPFGVNVMLLSPHADDVAKVVVEEGIKVVTTGAGNPENIWICGRPQALRSFQLLHLLLWHAVWKIWS